MKRYFGLFVVFFASIFLVMSDRIVAYSQELQDAYYWAYQQKITTKTSIDDANLDGNITRQAMAKMIVNYAENSLGKTVDVSSSCSFPDEDEIVSDLKPYVKRACMFGFMGKNGEKFRPMASVTRAQFGTILSRLLWGNKYEGSGEDYYLSHLSALKNEGIVNNIMDPKNIIEKRGNIMLMLMRSKDVNSVSNSSQSVVNNGKNTDSEVDLDILSDENPLEKVLYTGDDGTTYSYVPFLDVLISLAEKRGESNLEEMFKIEKEYYKDNTVGLEDLKNLDLDSLTDAEQLKTVKVILEKYGLEGVADLDFDKMDNEQKFGVLLGILDKLENMIVKKNEDYVKSFEKLEKKLGSESGKYSVKEKISKIKKYIDESNVTIKMLFSSFKSILKTLRDAPVGEDGEPELTDEQSSEMFGNVFGLLGIGLSAQAKSNEHQTYLNEFAQYHYKRLK